MLKLVEKPEVTPGEWLADFATQAVLPVGWIAGLSPVKEAIKEKGDEMAKEEPLEFLLAAFFVASLVPIKEKPNLTLVKKDS